MPHDSHKSYYGKAIVTTTTNGKGEKILTLTSYSTEVATYNEDQRKMTIHGWFSATTARHINSFLVGCGFEPCSKRELMNYKG